MKPYGGGMAGKIHNALIRLAVVMAGTVLLLAATGPASKAESSKAGTPKVETAKAEISKEGGKAPAVAPGLQPWEPAPEEFLKVLNDRKRELDQREEAVRKEENRLKILKNDIDRSLKELSDLRNALKNPGPGGKKPEGKVDQLVRVYEAMPAEEAASRLGAMEEKLAVDLLSRMKGKTVAKIFTSMSVEKVAALSSKLAR